MTDQTRQVEEWYKKNADRLAAKFSKAEFIKKDWDPLRGGVTIELEGPSVIASFTFWYKGDVTASVLKKGSEKPLFLDDRVLAPSEDMNVLLDGYLREIEKLA